MKEVYLTRISSAAIHCHFHLEIESPSLRIDVCPELSPRLMALLHQGLLYPSVIASSVT